MEAIAAQGRERGFVTSGDLLRGLSLEDLSPEQVEAFLMDVQAYLRQEGIDVLETPREASEDEVGKGRGIRQRLGYRLAVLVFLGAVALNDVILAVRGTSPGVLRNARRSGLRRRAPRPRWRSWGPSSRPWSSSGSPRKAEESLFPVRSGVVVVLAAVGAVYAFVGSRETRAAQEGRLPAPWGGPEAERHAAAMISLFGGIVAVVLPLTAGMIGWLAILAIPAAIGALIAGVRELRWAGRDPVFRAAAASGIGMAFLPMHVLLLGLLLYGLAR